MAGACPVSLSVAVADAGGMGAMGALLSSPDAIANWAAEFRSRSLGPFTGCHFGQGKAQPSPAANLRGTSSAARGFKPKSFYPDAIAQVVRETRANGLRNR